MPDFDDFIKGVAMVLEGESLKAGAMVKHGPSLGMLREKFVTRLIKEATPDRLRVGSGIIFESQDAVSNQCDILIYDANNEPPLYRWDDFAIVSARNARAVIEVKSDLSKKGFESSVEVFHSVRNVARASFLPVLVYAINGMHFDTFVKHVSREFRQRGSQPPKEPAAFRLPECTAVQDQHYFGIRPTYLRFDPSTHRLAHPIYYCAVDIKKAVRGTSPSIQGLETAVFINTYKTMLADGIVRWSPEVLYGWFNALPVTPAGKIWIDENGVVHTGNIPSFGFR